MVSNPPPGTYPCVVTTTCYKYAHHCRPAQECWFHPLALVLLLVLPVPRLACPGQHHFLLFSSVRVSSSRGCFLLHAALFLSPSVTPSTFFCLFEPILSLPQIDVIVTCRCLNVAWRKGRYKHKIVISLVGSFMASRGFSHT